MSPTRWAWLAAGVCAAGLWSACTSDDIQFGDREPFNSAADRVSGFLGYFDASDKLTTCANCHGRSQKEWEGTRHADAFVTLESSGEAEDFCFACHTVNERGNAVARPAGWNVAAVDAYHDVQCESCHGPGVEHVANPSGSQPIPSLAVPSGLDDGCAECHQGNHHRFAEEWSRSKHAVVVQSAAAREECASCHRGQAVLRAWGVRARYREQEAAEHLPITCGVCHDPHDATNAGQLRFPIETTSQEEHLCARCHDRRSVPDPGSSLGLQPHAPEAALLLGDAGWFPPDLGIDQGQIVASHGSELNDRLCAACHVNSFTVTDRETGAFVFEATGHLFTAIPCVDTQGIPQTGTCDFTVAARSFQACAQSICHVSEDRAATALDLARTKIDLRAAELLSALTQVDANLAEPGGVIDATDNIFTVAEGAFFNYNLATFGGDVTASSVHNPFLTEALLIGSIAAVEDEYGVTPAIGDGSTNWSAELDAAVNRR